MSRKIPHTPKRQQVDYFYLGRSRVIEVIFSTLISFYLKRLSKEHIKNGRHQLAIYSYDLIGHSINLNGIYERDELTVLFQWLKKRDLINGFAVDVGANIGNHSLFFQKHFEGVFSFEPNPKTFELLRLNAALASNIEIFNFGLSDAEGEAVIAYNSLNIGGAAIRRETDGTTSSQKSHIQLEMLDNVPDVQSKKIGLIKIDVEGHELSALIGAKKTITGNRPVIIFEQRVEDFSNGSTPVIDLLKSIGYQNFYEIRPSPRLPTNLVGFIRYPLTIVLRILFRYRYKVCKRDFFNPDYYPFVIATP